MGAAAGAAGAGGTHAQPGGTTSSDQQQAAGGKEDGGGRTLQTPKVGSTPSQLRQGVLMGRVQAASAGSESSFYLGQHNSTISFQ